MIISDLSNMNRKKTGGLYETVAHQKSGIVHLFFLFCFPHRLSPAPFTLKTKSSSWNLHAVFLIQIPLTAQLFERKAFTDKYFFIHCFTSRPPPSESQTALNSSLRGNWKRMSSSPNPGTSLDFHLASLFFTREASSLVRTQCLRKAQQLKHKPEPASGWWPSWPPVTREEWRKGVQCGVTCSSLGMWSRVRSMGLVVEKWTDSREGEKAGKIPYRHSRGIPSILASLMS